MSPENKPGWAFIALGPVKKWLSRLPRQDQERIFMAFRTLTIDPFSLDLKPLHGRSEWRLRLGGWWVLLRMDPVKREIVAVHAGARGDVYK